MKLSVSNKNYCATVVEINTLIPLLGCDNVQAAVIFNNQVIVGKDVNKGDRGLYFPLECALSEKFLSENNLYRHENLNKDVTKKGWFEDNGRIRAVKFRGHKSEGYFISLNGLAFTKVQISSLDLGSEFDNIEGEEICKKYTPKIIKGTVSTNNKAGKKVKRISKLLDGQFKKHVDTPQLRKNIQKIDPDQYISVTKKLHRTSFVVGNVLTKRKLKWYEKIIIWLGVLFKMDISSTVYSIIYSSRNVVKNEFEENLKEGFYKYDLWGDIAKDLTPFLEKGVTLYGEAVGFLKTGGCIQDGYDYGCSEKQHSIYVYRGTFTNHLGDSLEMSVRELGSYCTKRGIKTVPQEYYGKAKDLFPLPIDNMWHEHFMNMLEKMYLEKDCKMCKNNVPEEGIVLRVDTPFEYEAYKLKSYRFFERETKQLDKGIIDIESEN